MEDKQRSTSSVQDKHTPGPWHVERDNGIYAKDQYIGLSLKGFTYDKGLPYKANARLMAAAPELLNFAKDALGLLYGSIIFKDGKSQFDQSERDKLAAMLLRDGLEILTKIEGDE